MGFELAVILAAAYAIVGFEYGELSERKKRTRGARIVRWGLRSCLLLGAIASALHGLHAQEEADAERADLMREVRRTLVSAGNTRINLTMRFSRDNPVVKPYYERIAKFSADTDRERPRPRLPAPNPALPGESLFSEYLRSMSLQLLLLNSKHETAWYKCKSRGLAYGLFGGWLEVVVNADCEPEYRQGFHSALDLDGTKAAIAIAPTPSKDFDAELQLFQNGRIYMVDHLRAEDEEGGLHSGILRPASLTYVSVSNQSPMESPWAGDKHDWYWDGFVPSGGQSGTPKK